MAPDWLMSAPGLSAWHVPARIRTRLVDELVLTAPYDNGVCIYLGPVSTGLDFTRFPEFAPIVDWFRGQFGSRETWLRLDANGLTAPDLPVYAD